MTHIIVTRALVILSATLAAAAVAFGFLVNRPSEMTAGHPTADAPAGTTLFDVHCAGCHTESDIVEWLRAAPSLGAGRRDLAALLASHGDGSADQDAAIIDYLSAQVGSGLVPSADSPRVSSVAISVAEGRVSERLPFGTGGADLRGLERIRLAPPGATPRALLGADPSRIRK